MEESFRRCSTRTIIMVTDRRSQSRRREVISLWIIRCDNVKMVSAYHLVKAVKQHCLTSAACAHSEGRNGAGNGTRERLSRVWDGNYIPSHVDLSTALQHLDVSCKLPHIPLNKGVLFILEDFPFFEKWL